MKIAWVFATVTIVACSKSPAPAPTPPVPMPASVVAVMSLPSIDATLPGVAAWVDAIDPGAGTTMRDELDAELRPRAIDGTRSLHLVFVAPPLGDDEPDLVLVAATRDAAATSRKLDDEHVARTANGWAVIGEPAVVDLAFAWATTVLVSAPAPTRAKATFYPAAIRARWGAEVKARLESSGSPVESMARDFIVGLIDDTERVDAFADIEAGDVIAEIAIAPRAGSTFAAVLASQRPSTFTLLERLPLTSPSGTMAGHVELGPLARPVHDLVTSLIRAHVVESEEVTRHLLGVIDVIGTHATGEYAGMTIISDKAAINTLELRGAARLGASLELLVEAVLAIPMPVGLRVDVVRMGPHGGVGVTVATMYFGEAAVASASWATWDETLAFAMTDPDGALTRAAIEGSRVPPKVPGNMARALADARARGDSLIATFDVLPDGQQPLVLAFGVRDGAAYLWTRLPAAQIAGMAAMDDDSSEGWSSE